MDRGDVILLIMVMICWPQGVVRNESAWEIAC